MTTLSHYVALVGLIALTSCTNHQPATPLAGTWELVAATATEKDSTYSTFDPSHQMIKIINDTHFSFLNHSKNKPADSTQTGFTAGGGRYSLADSTYTEHLDYFSDKAWEGKKFEFTVRINGDTLVQKGVEKIPERGIDHIIVETYKRINK